MRNGGQRGTEVKLTVTGERLDDFEGLIFFSPGFTQKSVDKVEKGKVDLTIAIAPDVPTLEELGYKGLEVITWHALLAPAGFNKALADKMQGEIRRALLAPAMKEKLARDGVDAIASSPAELDAFMRSDIEKWRKVIQTAKIRNE